MNKVKGMKKKSMGSRLARLGRPAKAGKRRPPHLRSERSSDGKRQWMYA